MTDLQGGARVLIQNIENTYQEYGNYTIVTTSENGTIGFNISGNVQRYRLLIKPCSAYDNWQLSISLQTDAIPPYIPAGSDFDGDGIPAALEWALRLSSFAATPGSMPPPYFDGSNWRVNLPMPAGGAAADILATESEDLVHWTDFPASRNNLSGSVISTGRLAGAVLTLNRPGAARNFLRFSVND